MIIELPEKFSYESKKYGSKCAKVKNRILYIKPGVDIEKLMYSLTYSIKGRRRCGYCGQKVAKEKITIDHIYPKHFGGISITNNLQPACSNCNIEKANLNYEQYMIYRSLPKCDRKKFLQRTIRSKEQIRKNIGYDLPKEWVVMKNVSDIKCSDFGRTKGKNYDIIKKQYEEYGTFRKPITTDRYLNLLDGYNTYRYAIENGVTLVPVVILENVELIN